MKNCNSNLLTLAWTLTILCCGQVGHLTGRKIVNDVTHYKVDTLSGFFLYELNVPFNCYMNVGSPKQGNSLLYNTDSVLNQRNINELYKKGMFILSSDYIEEEAKKNHIDIIQNRDMKFYFFGLMAPYMGNDTTLQKSVKYDVTNNLAYKRVYIKMVVLNTGKVIKLVPRIDNYKCCDSNIPMEVQTYFVKEFLKVKIE